MSSRSSTVSGDRAHYRQLDSGVYVPLLRSLLLEPGLPFLADRLPDGKWSAQVFGNTIVAKNWCQLEEAIFALASDGDEEEAEAEEE